MISNEGILKLTDFGIAKVIGGISTTQSGEFKGTVRYMSPEQVNQQSPDSRSDLFSLAAVTFEMLTGTSPWSGTAYIEIMNQITGAAPRSLAEYNIPTAVVLDPIFQKALAKDPNDRYQSGKAFVQALKAATFVDAPVYGRGKRWAVLVGVNTYQDSSNYPSLSVCVSDAQAIYQHLAASGFEAAHIRLLTDGTPKLPTRGNILTALQAIANATEEEDLLLFYYSGHGQVDNDESYLVAHDGQHLVLRDTAVSVSRVKEIMGSAPARAKVMILDACHSGANIGKKSAEPMSAEFIDRVFAQAEGMAILSSCKQNEVSYEWQNEGRSAFTHFLLEALTGGADRDEKGFVTIQDTSRYVVDRVKLWSSQHYRSQTPTLQYNVAGDIVLAFYR